MAIEHPPVPPTDAPQPLAPTSAGPVDLALDISLTEPAPAANPIALPAGHVLHEYTIESVLGTGGFGITYLARDGHLQNKVAIKEYLPGDLATRGEHSRVLPRSSSDSQGYAEGLARFLSEARVLASFRHPHIVRVNRFFEANGTAYMVMDYEQGQPLRHWIKARGGADEAQLRRMFAGLLDGLEQVHKAGVVHRDIKPSNIYVRDSDSSLVLLDFGAALQPSAQASRSVTSLVTPGFAPLEQYHARGALGPWSDLYALGGVLYWLVTGHKPVEAPSRVKNDCLPAAADVAAGRYSDDFLRMIDWAMTMDEQHRPQSVAAFRPVFLGEEPAPALARKTPAHDSGHDGDTVRLRDQPTTESANTEDGTSTPQHSRIPLLLVLIGILVATVLAYFAWGRTPQPGKPTTTTPPLAAIPSKNKAAAPANGQSTGEKESDSTTGAKTESQRAFACSDLPFALRVTCTVEGKDVIRKCAPDLKNWNHDRPGCKRNSGQAQGQH